MEIERIESGILGLDSLIEGGFVKGSTNLIAGTTGTGKTTLSCQYILHGLRNGQAGVYITLEQSQDDILADVSTFGWDKELKKYIEQGKLIMFYQPPTDIKELHDVTHDLIKRINAQRFVLDSLSVATMGWKISSMDVGKIRTEIFEYFRMLKRTGATSMLITEIPETRQRSLSRFGFEEFVADSVIILHYLEYAAGGIPRSLLIRKMRRTDHKNDVYPLQITKNGIKILATKR